MGLVAVLEHDVSRVADRGSGLLRFSAAPPWGRTCWNADLTTSTASSPVSLASSLLSLAFGAGLGDFLGGGDTLVLCGGGTARLRVPGVKSGEVEVAKVNADSCLFPDCVRRSLSLGMRGSVVVTGWGGGGGGGYPRSGGRKPGGGAGGGTVGKAPPATNPAPVTGLCGCWCRL